MSEQASDYRVYIIGDMRRAKTRTEISISYIVKRIGDIFKRINASEQKKRETF